MIKIIQEWKEFLESEKNFSKHTFEAYMIDLNQFKSFITEYHNQEFSLDLLSSLKINDFRAWLAQRKRDNFANSSTARAIASVKNFFRYLIKYNNFTNKTIFTLKTPKLQQSLPKALSFEQTELALKNIDHVGSEEWIIKRDEALLYIIYGCGLRISEALSLKVTDLESDCLKIIGKGSKERIVPILPLVLKHIKQYIEVCPYKLEREDFIFVGERGKPLDPAVFQRQVRKLRRMLNLPESVTPHAFRHSFATHILSNGGDLKSIQELLGHEDLSTTQKYTKIETSHLLDVYKKAHPLGK